MNRHVALASGLILLGGIAFSPQVNAQSVKFELAQAASTCTYSNPVAGILVSPTGQPNQLAAWEGISGSQLGQINVDCKSAVTIRVSQPIQTSGPIQNLATVARVTVQGIGSADSPNVTNGIPSISIPASRLPAILGVGMRASTNDGSILPAGTYTFTVNLTAAQN
jgi:hypothetical protein